MPRIKQEASMPRTAPTVFKQEASMPRTAPTVFKQEASMPRTTSTVFKQEASMPRTETLIMSKQDTTIHSSEIPGVAKQASSMQSWQKDINLPTGRQEEHH